MKIKKGKRKKRKEKRERATNQYSLSTLHFWVCQL